MKSGFLVAALILSAQTAMACPGRATIFDITLGQTATSLPVDFTDLTCGSNGGPPGRPLTGFDQAATCRADVDGLYEVILRYDDAPEFTARALDQSHLVRQCAGTTVFDIAVMASVLIDGNGIVQGLRLISDPRAIPPEDRNDHWALAPLMRRQLGGDWTCDTPALPAGAMPVAGISPLKTCRQSNGVTDITTVEEYFHRAGQSYRDDLDVVQPAYFVATAQVDIALR